MPVRGTDDEWPRWNASARYVDDVLDRATWRSTFTCWIFRDLQVGVEVNPLVDEVGPLLTWRLLDEGEIVPAVILGSSSDRIGTPDGQSVYATASKSLLHWLDLPLSPYAGLMYGEWDDRVRGIGGLTVRYSDRFWSMHMFDGVNVHHVVGWEIDGTHTAQLLAVELGDERHVGLAYAVRF